MSVPSTNSSRLPAEAALLFAMHIPPPHPGSPVLRNRPAQPDEQAYEATVSGNGMKRGRPTEAEEEGMDIETSTEPVIKRRRGNGEAVTPELLQALIAAGAIADLRELLNENARIDDPDQNGMTPLMYACSIGQLDIARMLRQRGANLASKGYSCLHYAVASGHEAMVAWLLNEGADVNDAGNLLRFTPLMKACGQGNLNVVRLLFQRGANLTSRDVNSFSGLHYAAENGHEAVVTWWLDQGADINDRSNGFSQTPLILACENGHLQLAQLLHRRGANLAAEDTFGQGCLAHAAKEGHEAIVNWLLDLGLDVNEPNNKVTPIMRACSNGQFDMAKLLKARGASLAPKRPHEDNCLLRAAASGNAALVGWLLDEGVSCDASNDEGLTPLLVACDEGHLDIVCLLHSRGASLAAKDKNRQGCLHFAVENDHEAVVAWLLEHGANVNEPAEGGSTPLTYACVRSNLNVAKLLIAHGAHLDLIDKWTGVPIGEVISWLAYDADRYDVLLSLIAQNWTFPEDWGPPPAENAVEDSSDEGNGRIMIARSPEETGIPIGLKQVAAQSLGH